MREAERLLAALASHGVEVRLAPDGRLIVRGRAPRPTALLAEARKQAKALAELLRQRGTTSPPERGIFRASPERSKFRERGCRFRLFPGKNAKPASMQPACTPENAG
jgi:hypothetical protein